MRDEQLRSKWQNIGRADFMIPLGFMEATPSWAKATPRFRPRSLVKDPWQFPSIYQRAKLQKPSTTPNVLCHYFPPLHFNLFRLRFQAQNIPAFCQPCTFLQPFCHTRLNISPFHLNSYHCTKLQLKHYFQLKAPLDFPGGTETFLLLDIFAFFLHSP